MPSHRQSFCNVLFVRPVGRRPVGGGEHDESVKGLAVSQNNCPHCTASAVMLMRQGLAHIGRHASSRWLNLFSAADPIIIGVHALSSTINKLR